MNAGDDNAAAKLHRHQQIVDYGWLREVGRALQMRAEKIQEVNRKRVMDGEGDVSIGELAGASYAEIAGPCFAARQAKVGSDWLLAERNRKSAVAAALNMQRNQAGTSTLVLYTRRITE